MSGQRVVNHLRLLPRWQKWSGEGMDEVARSGSDVAGASMGLSFVRIVFCVLYFQTHTCSYVVSQRPAIRPSSPSLTGINQSCVGAYRGIAFASFYVYDPYETEIWGWFKFTAIIRLSCE